MKKWITCLVAVAAAACVLAVLISPALDELPSTAPHAFHHAAFLFVSILPFQLGIRPGSEKIWSPRFVLHQGSDVL